MSPKTILILGGYGSTGRLIAKKIDSASRRAGLTPETRAHLQDSADTLAQALAAQMVRSGT